MSIWPHLCSVYVDALWPALNPVVIITSAVFGTGISCQHTHPVLMKSEGVRACIYYMERDAGKTIPSESWPVQALKWSFTILLFTLLFLTDLLFSCRAEEVTWFISLLCGRYWFTMFWDPDRTRFTSLSLFTKRLEIAAFFHPSFQQLSQTPEYEAVCAISQRRACRSMLSVHVNSSARSVWTRGLDGVCRLLLWDVSLDCSVNEILLHRLWFLFVSTCEVK